MSAEQAADTLLLRGKDKEPEYFTKKQAERILDLQKRTGFADYAEPEPEAEAAPTTEANADNGQPSDSVDTNAGKRKGSKAGE